MGYGDFAPPSGGRPKPLTKKQLQKMRQAYQDAGVIAEHIKVFEHDENLSAAKKAQEDIEKTFLL